MAGERTSRKLYVEREGKLAEFEQFLESDSTHILHIFTQGDGGIGKTQLVLRFQRYCQENPGSFISANELIDFYHTESHSNLGVIRQITTYLGQENFPKFQQLLNKYDEEKDPSVRQSQFSLLEKLFREDYKAFAQAQHEAHRRIVLFFDTYEVIQNVDEEKNSADSTESSRWIETELFPALAENTKLIVSGRYRLTEIDSTKLTAQEIKLSHFSLAETEEFLKKRFKSDEKKLIDKIGSKERINIFHTLAKGRPILLALLVDAIDYEKKPLSPESLLDEIAQETREILEPITKTQQELFEKALIRRIAEVPTPEDRVVTYMAIAYRRMTPGLLSFLFEKPIEKAQKILETLETFSFIKVKEADGVYLLHDEMRRMIIELWWDVQDPARTMRQEIAEKIVAYYDQELLVRHDLSEVEREIYIAEAIEYKFLANARNNPREALERFGEEFDVALQDGRHNRCDMLLRIANDYYHNFPFPQNHHIDWRRLDYYRQTNRQNQEEIFAQAKKLLDENKNNQEWWQSELPGHLFYVYGATAENFDEAVNALRKASDLFCEKGLDYWMYRTDNLIGYIYCRQGKFIEAKELLERARKGFYELLLYERPRKKGKVRQLLHGFQLAMGNLAVIYTIVR